MIIDSRPERLSHALLLSWNNSQNVQLLRNIAGSIIKFSIYPSSSPNYHFHVLMDLQVFKRFFDRFIIFLKAMKTTE